MTSLTRQRCFNHSRREAAARCVECGRFYCRECVTEHEHRVICARCLRQRAAAAPSGRSIWRRMTKAGCAVVAVLALWAMFYLLGQSLLLIPDDFHEGAMWKVEWWDLE